MMHFFSRAQVATYCVLILFLFSAAANAQERFPDNGPLFDNSSPAITSDSSMVDRGTLVGEI